MLKRIVRGNCITSVILLLFAFLIFSCAGNPAARSVPAWVNSVEAVYPRAQYVAATGYASTRSAAENNALAALVSYFGQTVDVETNAISMYQQAVASGVADVWINTAEMRNEIRTSAAMDNIMGVEIREVWFDSRDTYYAVAVMEKNRAARIYSDLVSANQSIITNLINMSPGIENSLDGVVRYRLAAVVADMNIYYRNILRLLDAPAADTMTAGSYYRMEAQNIISTIPINIRVADDRNGRIYGAFARCFADWGFDASSVNARYVLNVNAALNQVNLANNQNYFSRIEISATLTDTAAGTVLLPYNFNTREGHTSLIDAENRAITMAERDIIEEFGSMLSGYLNSLSPVN